MQKHDTKWVTKRNLVDSRRAKKEKVNVVLFGNENDTSTDLGAINKLCVWSACSIMSESF